MSRSIIYLIPKIAKSSHWFFRTIVTIEMKFLKYWLTSLWVSPTIYFIYAITLLYIKRNKLQVFSLQNKNSEDNGNGGARLARINKISYLTLESLICEKNVSWIIVFIREAWYWEEMRPWWTSIYSMQQVKCNFSSSHFSYFNLFHLFQI